MYTCLCSKKNCIIYIHTKLMQCIVILHRTILVFKKKSKLLQAQISKLRHLCHFFINAISGANN